MCSRQGGNAFIAAHPSMPELLAYRGNQTSREALNDRATEEWLPPLKRPPGDYLSQGPEGFAHDLRSFFRRNYHRILGRFAGPVELRPTTGLALPAQRRRGEDGGLVRRRG